jgi:hypothetical protein
VSCLQAYPDMGDAQSHQQLNLLEGSTPVRAYGGSTDAQGGRALVVSLLGSSGADAAPAARFASTGMCIDRRRSPATYWAGSRWKPPMIFHPFRKRDRSQPYTHHADAAPKLREYVWLLAATFFASVTAYGVLIYWSA